MGRGGTRHCAVPAILRVSGHVHTRPAAIFLVRGATCQAFAGRADLPGSAGQRATPAVARVVRGVDARGPALGGPVVASDDTSARLTLCHAVRRNVTGVPAGTAVELIARRVDAVRRTRDVAVVTGDAAVRGVAGRIAVFRHGTAQAAISTMGWRGVGVHARSAAVRAARRATAAAGTFRADLSGAALRVARAATSRGIRNVDARPTAVLEWAATHDPAHTGLADRGATGLRADVPARSTVLGVSIEIRARRAARRVPVVAGECAAAERTDRLTMRRSRAGRGTASAVRRIRAEHDAIRAAHRLSVATGGWRTHAQVAAWVTHVARSAATIDVTLFTVQIR